MDFRGKEQDRLVQAGNFPDAVEAGNAPECCLMVSSMVRMLAEVVCLAGVRGHGGGPSAIPVDPALLAAYSSGGVSVAALCWANNAVLAVFRPVLAGGKVFEG